MKLRLRRAAGVLATIVLGCWGCSAPPLEEHGAYAIVQSRAATPLAAADSFLRPGDASRVFELALDDRSPRVIEHHAEPTDRFGAAWRVVEGDVRELFLRLDADDNVVLCAVIEHADRAISLFQPPLVVAYARMIPGEVLSQEVAMRVVDRDRPQRLKEQGTTTQTITLVEETLIDRFEGETWTSQLQVEFVAMLRRATVRREATLYLSHRDGVLAEESEKTVRALGLIIRRTRETRVRQPSPANDAT